MVTMFFHTLCGSREIWEWEGQGVMGDERAASSPPARSARCQARDRRRADPAMLTTTGVRSLLAAIGLTTSKATERSEADP